MRLLGALFVGGVGATIFLLLLKMGCGRVLSFLVAANMAVLPAGQLIAGWAVAVTWTNALGALFGLAAFCCAERAFAGAVSWRRIAGVLAAGGLMASGIMVYQPNSLFYIVGVGADENAR